MSGRKNTGSRIRLENVGPVAEADIRLGDLTVLVGPQASGKSIFLQTLKLAMDSYHIRDFFKQHNVEFNGDARAFVDGYYGLGMGGMLNGKPHVTWAGKRTSLESLTLTRKSATNQEEQLFYIPAQRVVSLPSGVSQPFSAFKFGDPYVLRYFAHQVHILLQSEFADLSTLFPVGQKLNEALRQPISSAFFDGAEVTLEQKDYTRTLVLKVEGLSEGLPFLLWSAGQREFVPLLLGLYWLCPSGQTAKRDSIEWVVIEEPEMGLHPRAIEAFLLLVLELLRREYKVVLSTHSPAVLDLVWVLRYITAGGLPSDIRKLFSQPANLSINKIAESSLDKSTRVYFFERGLSAKDISSLDPESDDEAISNWGDLNTFSGRSADVVAEIVSRNSLGAAPE